MSGFSFYNYYRFKRPRLKLNYCERLRSRLTGCADAAINNNVKH